MDDTIDLLQIKIEQAKAQLPESTLNAINSVDWKSIVLSFRETKGYSFEQLESLEIETELVLCGLISPRDYPAEVQNRMKISKVATDELVNEMNTQVFAKIREELIKSTERKKLFAKKLANEEKPEEKQPDIKIDNSVLHSAGIEILNPSPSQGEGQGVRSIPKLDKIEITGQVAKTAEPAPTQAVHPIIAQKLSTPVRIGTVKTEHTLENITKIKLPATPEVKNKIPNIDPYREVPE